MSDRLEASMVALDRHGLLRPKLITDPRAPDCPIGKRVLELVVPVAYLEKHVLETHGSALPLVSGIAKFYVGLPSRATVLMALICKGIEESLTQHMPALLEDLQPVRLYYTRPDEAESTVAAEIRAAVTYLESPAAEATLSAFYTWLCARW